MSRKIRFQRSEPTCPARVASGDHGAIWKCFDFEREPIGFLVTTGPDCNKPVAYVGVQPAVMLPGAPAGATFRYVGVDLPAFYQTALRIAVDFQNAALRPAVDLRTTTGKDRDTFPDFLFCMILKPTNGDDRAVRYRFAGATYRPFRLSADEKMGVAMFLAESEADLPARRLKRKRPSSEPITQLPGSEGEKALTTAA